MKYRDLIQFESVTEVIQLRWADKKENAKQLVSTYVISDRMADLIINRILPAVRCEENESGRGLFIVGNYGTGKSHLMAMITAVAEYEELLDYVTHPSVKRGLKNIAGKFKVIRQETGASTMHLRDVVLQDLEKQLQKIGVSFHFPSMDQTASNKQLLIDMMNEFKKIFPDQSLLIALDELLDFLRTRNERQLVMDLNFLREVGEACELVPLRFVTGIQEALFDNPSFQFAADSIRRVRARYDQISISREDIAFVVSKRLLAKTDQQKRSIRKHLESFTSLYEAMAEHLDQYIDLFPVHPDYMEIFEQVTIGERRDLLKALSTQMSTLLDKDVPQDAPGLIAFDSYWEILSGDQAYRTIPDVRNVLDKTKVLTNRVASASSMKEYKTTALRIINGLAIHRLTVGDIYAPIGLTASELRDRLCLHIDLPEKDADFLLVTIETILAEISKAVSGQFLTHNSGNDQYYLDLKKDIDFDALIAQKADTLDNSTINRYYFDLIQQLMEISRGSYVTGFRIWDIEIPWKTHHITRKGYLFLGAANERSTAHPERDFYIHFLNRTQKPELKIQVKLDEVYFFFDTEDESFLKYLRLYAGAKEMSIISSGSNKDQYEAKARSLFVKITGWMRENFLRFYRVFYMGDSQSVIDVIAKSQLNLHNLTFRDQIYAISSAFLDAYFETKFPDFPVFEDFHLTGDTSRESSDAALRTIAGGPTPQAARTILKGLHLVKFEDGKMIWTIPEGMYAQHFLNLVLNQEEERVINRLDLIEGEPGAERDKRFKLESEWIAVILAALVKEGLITINLPGMHINEAETISTQRLGIETILRFSSISKPKAIPKQSLRALFNGLDLDVKVLEDPKQISIAIDRLIEAVESELRHVLGRLENLRNTPRVLQENIFENQEIQNMIADLEKYRDFLNQIGFYKAPAKLRSFSMEVLEIREAFSYKKWLHELDSVYAIIQVLQPSIDYLLTAQNFLPATHGWQKNYKETKQALITLLRDSSRRSESGVAGQMKGRLENLITDYGKAYLIEHKSSRLDREADEKKKKLTSDPRWGQLRALSSIDILQDQRFQQLKNELTNLNSCPNLTLYDLKAHPSCPNCGYVPSMEMNKVPAANKLENVKKEFDALNYHWLQALLTNLKDEKTIGSLDSLSPNEKRAVQEFLQKESFPEKITESFLNGIRDMLAGIEIIHIDSNDMLLELTKQGMPCRPEEFDKRYRKYMQDQLTGKDVSRIRIQIDW